MTSVSRPWSAVGRGALDSFVGRELRSVHRDAEDPADARAPAVSGTLSSGGGVDGRDQRAALHELQKEVETLREEIARLKKQKSRPVIKPSKLTEGDGRKQGGRKKAGEKPPRRVDRTVVVEAQNIPPGIRFKGYRNYTIQELIIRSETTLYRLATWLSPEGKLRMANLPAPHPAVGGSRSSLRTGVAELRPLSILPRDADRTDAAGGVAGVVRRDLVARTARADHGCIGHPTGRRVSTDSLGLTGHR